MIKRRVLAAVLGPAVLATVALAGCSSGGSSSPGGPSASGGSSDSTGSASAKPQPSATTVVSYWTEKRLLGAQALRVARPGGKLPRHAQAGLASIRVGALFVSEPDGDHFCTASVVDSPGRDLLVTAAHCINSGNGGGYRSNIVFIPGYRDGKTPFGIWTPARLVVASGWIKSGDPDLDVGFVVLQPHDGRNIEDVLGANTLDFNPGYRNLVRVTGYPQTADAPVTCQNWTTEQSATQLRFDCEGFTGGTSGSPFVTAFDHTTGTGHIVGILGGYQEGGDSPNISYSSYLSNAIRELYNQAIGNPAPVPAGSG